MSYGLDRGCAAAGPSAAGFRRPHRADRSGGLSVTTRTGPRHRHRPIRSRRARSMTATASGPGRSRWTSGPARRPTCDRWTAQGSSGSSCPRWPPSGPNWSSPARWSWSLGPWPSRSTGRLGPVLRRRRVAVTPGDLDAGGLDPPALVRLDAEDLSRPRQRHPHAHGPVHRRRSRQPAGGLDDFLDWWVVLRGRCSTHRAVHTPVRSTLRRPRRLRRSTCTGRSASTRTARRWPTSWARRATCTCVGVFDPAEMAAVSAEMDAAAAELPPGDGQVVVGPHRATATIGSCACSTSSSQSAATPPRCWPTIGCSALAGLTD